MDADEDDDTSETPQEIEREVVGGSRTEPESKCLNESPAPSFIAVSNALLAYEKESQLAIESWRTHALRKEQHYNIIARDIAKVREEKRALISRMILAENTCRFMLQTCKADGFVFNYCPKCNERNIECDDTGRCAVCKTDTRTHNNDFRPELSMVHTRGPARDRDALWCKALIDTLDPREMEKVTKRFNELRPDKE